MKIFLIILWGKNILNMEMWEHFNMLSAIWGEIPKCKSSLWACKDQEGLPGKGKEAGLQETLFLSLSGSRN